MNKPKVQNAIKMTSSITKSPASSKTTKKVSTEWKDRISPENYQLLRETFLIFDQDGNGTIDPIEVTKLLQQLGLHNRNPNILNIITALRQTNKNLTFDEFVDVACSYTGEVKTKDGIKRLFNLYDKEGTGLIEFQQLKSVARSLGDYSTDTDLLDLMHSVFINHQTTSNESISFEEFYTVISSYYNKKQGQKKS